MALKGQMFTKYTPISKDQVIELVNVSGKGILKNLGAHTNTTDAKIKIIFDDQVIVSNSFGELRLLLGLSGGAGIWASASSSEVNTVFNLPFTSGFSIEITGGTANHIALSVLWAVEV